MPAEDPTAPFLHSPPEQPVRPKGILKNPSFEVSGRRASSPTFEATPPSAALDPQESKDLTLQNTIQNAGHRRSSSAARRASASRRQSQAVNQATPSGEGGEDDPDKMRLKWDEANLYLAEQESGGRMKITEPKTPYQYGGGAMEVEEEEEDVAIDPRYVNVDEMDMALAQQGQRASGSGSGKKHRESDIPGLELGEPEDDVGQAAGTEDERIIRHSSLSRESSKEKHVSVSSGSGQGMEGLVGMPTVEEEEKHREFEERRKKHYEMKDIRGLLGHPEEDDEMEDDDENRSPTDTQTSARTSLPDRGINGTR